MLMNCHLGGQSVFLISNTSALMCLNNFLTVRTWLACYLAGSISLIVLWCCLYLLWVPVLQLPYPIPLIAVFAANAGNSIIILVIWFKFPVTWRQDPDFRHRAKYLLLALGFILMLNFEYWFYSWVFYALPVDLQFIMSFILPLSREIGAFALTKGSIKLKKNRL